MSRKKKTTPKVNADARAKLEVTAKATYQHKKTVTEIIPPDVTRAKANKWLDLFSPITEFAALKADAIRYRRLQLRIEQDATLERLSDAVHNKMKNKEVVHPLPPKIIIPALEAASLESPTSPLVGWWADLLVSGATKMVLRPYHVDLMGKIGADEARLLDGLWKRFAPDFARHPIFADIIYMGRIEGALRAMADQMKKKRGVRWRKDILKTLEKQFIDVVNRAHEDGIPMQVFYPHHEASSAVYPQDILDEDHSSLDVALALRLLEIRESNFSGRFPNFKARMLIFTPLGIEFMSACRPTDTGAGRFL